MKTAHIFVSGFVQGVGYRHFVRSSAQKLGLTGWVANVQDGKACPQRQQTGLRGGRVEALFQGSKENIEKMIQLCRKGPFLSEVENVEVEWNKTEESFSDFRIIA
ncbi:MAG: acylphosphatase [Candidatus Levybacteria bacterium]|nr:acylphosphatase [Candidatus Levybacteria bacterium]